MFSAYTLWKLAHGGDRYIQFAVCQLVTLILCAKYPNEITRLVPSLEVKYRLSRKLRYFRLMSGRVSETTRDTQSHIKFC